MPYVLHMFDTLDFISPVSVTEVPDHYYIHGCIFMLLCFFETWTSKFVMHIY